MLNLGAVTLVIVLSLSWLSIVFYPSTQDFMRINPYWNGLRDFSNQFGAEMVTDLEEVTPWEGGSVLISIPYIPYRYEEIKRIEGFVRDGGSLLLMDDYRYGNQVLRGLGLQIEFITQPLLDPYLSYHNQWLPLVDDLATEIEEAGVQHLVLNHATALNISGPSKTLARSSDTSFIDRNGNASWDEMEPKGPFVVAARVALGQGTVTVVSDPSILINSMMGRGGNEAFLRHLISLSGDNPRVALDTSHLAKAPLDRSKDIWNTARERMSIPYSQVLLVGVILVMTLRPVWQKGDNVEPEQRPRSPAS